MKCLATGWRASFATTVRHFDTFRIEMHFFRKRYACMLRLQFYNLHVDLMIYWLCNWLKVVLAPDENSPRSKDFLTEATPNLKNFLTEISPYLKTYLLKLPQTWGFSKRNFLRHADFLPKILLCPQWYGRAAFRN